MKAALDEEELGEPHLAVQLPVTADDAGAGSIVEGAGGPTAKNCGELAMDTAVRPPPLQGCCSESVGRRQRATMDTRSRRAKVRAVQGRLPPAQLEAPLPQVRPLRLQRVLADRLVAAAAEILGTAETVRH